VVLHVADSVLKKDGGAPAAIWFYHKILTENHIESNIFAWNCSSTGEGAKPRGLLDNITLFRIGRRVIDLIRSLYEAKTVHLHEVWSPAIFLSLVFLQFNRRKKVILSPHGSLERWSLAHKKVKKLVPLLIFRILAKRVTFFFVTAKSESIAVGSLIGGARCLQHPFALQIDSEPYRSLATYKNRTILFLSRIDPKKGLERLIEAFSEINDRTWRLLIVGPCSDPKYLNKIETMIANSPLSGFIEYKGFVENPKNFYLQASFFVLPTFSENFGFAVPEALSMKLPVITTIDTPWDELNTADAGIVVTNDKSSIKQAMQELMEVSAFRLQMMGGNAYNYVVENYSHKNISKLVLNLYNCEPYGKA
jgi:glycosyltransferase involved in cell wall biosynthesis